MKQLAFFSLVIIFAWACSSEPQYIVKGKIEGSDSITFFLQKRESGQTINIDSAISKNGSFTMKGGAVEYPQLVQLVAGDTRKRTSFYLENSKISIEGTLDSLFKATISGSKTQDEYQSFIDVNKPLNDEYSALYSDYQSATQSGDAARVAEIEREAEDLQERMIENQKNFVKENPSSFVSPSVLSSLAYDMEAAELEEIINKFDPEIARLSQVAALKDRVQVMKSVAIGQKAPDFTMNDVDGNPVTLSSKFGPKLLLLDFWAGWCGPCRQENPNVVRVYEEFNKKGFDVFGVSLDQTKEDWLKAIEDDKLTWTHVSDLKYWDNAAARLYAVQAIPANFLLDENGTIIGKNLRAEDLYNKVSEVLGK
jgi:peroxiredoxin